VKERVVSKLDIDISRVLENDFGTAELSLGSATSDEK